VACFVSASDFVGGRNEFGNKMDAKGKGKAIPYRYWTSLQGYRRLRTPAWHIKVGSGCKSGKFNVNVYVLLVTGLYRQVTVVIQTSQPLCIY
jgi:hypothetical protein